MIDRRHFVLGGVALAASSCATKPRLGVKDFEARLAAIERSAGGRLGVQIWAHDIAPVGWRARERFALCSTFKLPLAALVLREAEAGRATLDETLAYGRADLLAHSPETERNLDKGGMTIEALCEAAISLSDNCAANLLLRRFGGPAALTRFWREIGDTETRLDRIEPKLNFVPPGEMRDTTTPEAMARGMAKYLLYSGEPALLSARGRASLFDCMQRSETGVNRIRAGLPPSWTIGDKTGTASAKGMANKVNDVAMFRTPDGAPFIVAAYYEPDAEAAPVRPQDEAVLKRVGEMAVQWAMELGI